MKIGRIGESYRCGWDTYYSISMLYALITATAVHPNPTQCAHKETHEYLLHLDLTTPATATTTITPTLYPAYPPGSNHDPERVSDKENTYLQLD